MFDWVLKTPLQSSSMHHLVSIFCSGLYAELSPISVMELFCENRLRLCVAYHKSNDWFLYEIERNYFRKKAPSQMFNWFQIHLCCLFILLQEKLHFYSSFTNFSQDIQTSCRYMWCRKDKKSSCRPLWWHAPLDGTECSNKKVMSLDKQYLWLKNVTLIL